MKKIITLLLVAVMAFGLVACGGSSSEAGGDTSATGSKYVFKTGDVEIAMNAKAEDIINALGQPLNYFESESCAFKGLDKEYTYNDFVIKTYPKDGVDYILSVSLTNDIVKTTEGAYIGMTLDEVRGVMGAPTNTIGSGGYQYVDGDCTILFVAEEEGDVVQSIQYTADTGVK